MSEYFNSMLYWWHKVAELDIPKPATVIESMEDIVEDVFRCVLSEGEDRDACAIAKEEVRALATALDEAVRERLGGYPVFMRTDYTSCKHYSTHVFGKPLYRIDSKEDFIRHIFPLIAECHSYIPARTAFGPPRPSAVVLREWLNIEEWTSKLPGPYGNIEVRVITENGRVIKIFPYYHRSGIEKHFSDAGPEVFKEYRERYVQAILEGLPEIIEYAEKIASASGIRGHDWSIDFALVNKDGKRMWYFIDMALAEASWVPAHETEEDRIIGTALEQLRRTTVRKYDIGLIRELANSGWDKIRDVLIKKLAEEGYGDAERRVTALIDDARIRATELVIRHFGHAYEELVDKVAKYIIAYYIAEDAVRARSPGT